VTRYGFPPKTEPVPLLDQVFFEPKIPENGVRSDIVARGAHRFPVPQGNDSVQIHIDRDDPVRSVELEVLIEAHVTLVRVLERTKQLPVHGVEHL